MRTVNIAKLKATLSQNIRRVRAGEEILICDRNRPVARIIPCESKSESDREKRLIAKGILTPPRRPKAPSLPEPAGNVSDEAMARIWQLERDGR